MDDQHDDLEIEPWAVGMHPHDALFVREWLVDMNTSRAALAAGHCSTLELSRKNSWKTLRRPAIMRGIAAAMSERAAALNISAKTVLGEAWRCYLLALDAGKFGDAHKFLTLVGQHVDVRAFRTKFGLNEPDDDEEDIAALSHLTTEELETLARLSRKAAGMDETEGAASTLRH